MNILYFWLIIGCISYNTIFGAIPVYRVRPSYCFYNTNISSPFFTSIIFRAEGGLLNLFGRSYSNNTTRLSILCNLNEEETTFHFVGRCPIFRFDRIKYFSKDTLDEFEFLDIMNGKNYYSLFKYICSCLQHREFIIKDCYC